MALVIHLVIKTSWNNVKYVPIGQSPARMHHSRDMTMADVTLRLLWRFIWFRGPKTHQHTYYYLCKHVILLSNEPFTVSVMKQLALTQAKWNSPEPPVCAARWKQMLHDPNAGVTDPVLWGTGRDSESASFSSAHWLHQKIFNSSCQTSLCENNA